MIERAWRRTAKPALLLLLAVAAAVSFQALIDDFSPRAIARTFLAVFPIVAIIVGLERIVRRLGSGLLAILTSTFRAGLYSGSLTAVLSGVASLFL